MSTSHNADAPLLRKHLSFNALLPCNYDCWYCFSPKEIRDRSVAAGLISQPEGRHRLADFLAKTGPWDVTFVGSGEISLLPGLPELCDALPTDSGISFITNLSDDCIVGIATTFGPSRIRRIQASLHPEADRQTFFHRVMDLKQIGVPIMVAFVAVPPQLSEIPSLADQCRELDVPLYVQVHIGEFRHREYPWSYSQTERELIERYTWDVFNYKALHGDVGVADARATPCGYARFVVYQWIDEGNVYGCSQRSRIFGNWIRGDFASDASPTPCTLAAGRCYYGIGMHELALKEAHCGDFTHYIDPLSDAEKSLVWQIGGSSDGSGSLSELWPPRVTALLGVRGSHGSRR